MVGGYVYGDYCSGRVWVVSAGAPYPATGTSKLTAPGNISSFGEDESGELFLVTLQGTIYRVGAS